MEAALCKALGAGAINGGIGAIAGMAGGAASAWATKGLGGALLGQLNVKASSALGGLVTGGIGGYAGGFAGGFATGLITTGNLGKAFNMGLSSGEMGGIIGASISGIRGFRAAAPGSNRLTGNTKAQVEKVYRVYGGEAKPLGKSWTPVDPNSVDNYRNAAGLPDANTGRFVIEGTINKADIILQRNALPFDGNSGGLMEYVIDPSKVNINRVSGVNPQF